ncbi:unnamed protein product, partial [Mesorhabditis spiculigera]
MSIHLLVPYTPPEWRRVRSLYHSTDVNELNEALQILNMWTNRMGEKNAIFVICTELIVRCGLEEQKLRLKPDASKMEQYKLLMGTCITR